MTEIWKDIAGFEQQYQVSNQGRIFSKRSNRTLTLIVNGNPIEYHKIMLSIGGVKKIFSVHRLVALQFIDNPLMLPFVNHKDRNPLNNNDWNLEWSSVRENTTHGYANKKEKSKSPGVYFSKRKGRQKRWVASIWYDGKNRGLGIYMEEHEAALAYQNALKRYGITNKYAQVA